MCVRIGPSSCRRDGISCNILHITVKAPKKADSDIQLLSSKLQLSLTSQWLGRCFEWPFYVVLPLESLSVTSSSPWCLGCTSGCGRTRTWRWWRWRRAWSGPRACEERSRSFDGDYSAWPSKENKGNKKSLHIYRRKRTGHGTLFSVVANHLQDSCRHSRLFASKIEKFAPANQSFNHSNLFRAEKTLMYFADVFWCSFSATYLISSI